MTIEKKDSLSAPAAGLETFAKKNAMSHLSIFSADI
jgi:hypothetical protein